jgi:two-component system, OmpR family, response regulator
MDEDLSHASWRLLPPEQPGDNAGNGDTRSARILVVDDDFEMCHAMVDYLAAQSLRAVAARDRQEAMRQFAIGEPSLVVLDLCLGKDDGLELLRYIRSRSDVPVIITTGYRRDEPDVVLGLELGADDYIAKPFGLRELVARVRAVLRRRATRSPRPERDANQGRCRFGGWELDRKRRRLVDSHGELVVLTKGEYALLIAFIDAPQRPLSREHLMRASRTHEDVFDRSIDVQILRLRRKLQVAPTSPQIIRTERGVGYVFTLPVELL